MASLLTFVVVLSLGLPYIYCMETKIINGENATITDAPWMASIIMIQKDGTLKRKCGGTLIAENLVLTSANCVKEEGRWLVIMGVTYWPELTNPNFQARKVIGATLHPDFITSPRPDNDLAVLEVEFNFDLDAYVNLVELGEDGDDARGTNCEIYGFGKTEMGPNYRLKMAEMEIISNFRCRVYYSAFWTSITVRQVCGQNFGAAACHGDQGGPLMCNGKQVGVISWFGELCTQGWPEVNTRIPFFRDWIDAQLV